MKVETGSWFELYNQEIAKILEIFHVNDSL